MQTVRDLLLFLHLVGFALLLGGAAVPAMTRQFRINQAMLSGAVAQIVTGVLLAMPIYHRAVEPDRAKLAVKLVIALAIVVMVFFSRRRAAVNPGHFLTIVGLTLANAAVAVFWG